MHPSQPHRRLVIDNVASAVAILNRSVYYHNDHWCFVDLDHGFDDIPAELDDLYAIIDDDDEPIYVDDHLDRRPDHHHNLYRPTDDIDRAGPAAAGPG